MKTAFQIIISVLIFISCSNNEEKFKLSFYELQKSYEKGSELFSEKSKQTKDRIKYVLSSEDKIEFKEIISLIDKLDKLYSDLYHLLSEQALDEIKIDASINNLIVNQKKDYKKLLEEKRKQLGLEEKHINQFVSKNIETLKTLNASRLVSAPNKELFASKVKFDLKMVENQLLNNLYNLTGGGGISCYFGILPIVIPSQNLIRRGERFRAKIGIVPHDYEFLASDMELTINGKFVPFDKGRFASFVSEPINTPSKKILISCKIRDKRTNEFIPAWDNYEYNIKTSE